MFERLEVCLKEVLVTTWVVPANSCSWHLAGIVQIAIHFRAAAPQITYPNSASPITTRLVTRMPRTIKPKRTHRIITIIPLHQRPIRQRQTRYILDRRVHARSCSTALQTHDRLLLRGTLDIWKSDIGDLEEWRVAVPWGAGEVYALRIAHWELYVVYGEVGEEDVFDICFEINIFSFTSSSFCFFVPLERRRGGLQTSNSSTSSIWRIADLLTSPCL